MKPMVATWLVFRLLRWAAWIVFLGFGAYFVSNRAPHLNSFGQLLHSTEAIMFGTGVGAVFLGFLELMMRERAGLPAPSLGQLMPPAGSPYQPLPDR